MDYPVHFWLVLIYSNLPNAHYYFLFVLLVVFNLLNFHICSFCSFVCLFVFTVLPPFIAALPFFVMFIVMLCWIMLNKSIIQQKKVTTINEISFVAEYRRTIRYLSKREVRVNSLPSLMEKPFFRWIAGWERWNWLSGKTPSVTETPLTKCCFA